VYVDAGLDAVRDVLLRLYASRLEGIDPSVTQKDAKTALQEFLQGRQLPLPRYLTVDIAGPAHDQRFTVACDLEAPVLRLLAEGRSRRQAEQEAARLVLEALRRPASGAAS
jgi:ribonuclease-3